MKIKTWHPEMSDKETADLAYWERNMLALRYADGWYYDVIDAPTETNPDNKLSHYEGWRRVLSLFGGRITFHIPDDFDIGSHLAEIKPNWDGHTTEEKWTRLAEGMGIKVEK